MVMTMLLYIRREGGRGREREGEREHKIKLTVGKTSLIFLTAMLTS